METESHTVIEVGFEIVGTRVELELHGALCTSVRISYPLKVLWRIILRHLPGVHLLIDDL